jgi:hypothetical protein
MCVAALTLLVLTTSLARSIGHANDAEDILVVVHARSRIDQLSAHQL